MSIRNYNSTRPRRRFCQRNLEIRKSKPIDYTEIYKLHGVPVHNAEAVRQFNEKRENHLRLQSLQKRDQIRKSREKYIKKMPETKMKKKKTNDQNKVKTNITNAELIKKKN